MELRHFLKNVVDVALEWKVVSVEFDVHHRYEYPANYLHAGTFRTVVWEEVVRVRLTE